MTTLKQMQEDAAAQAFIKVKFYAHPGDNWSCTARSFTGTFCSDCQPTMEAAWADLLRQAKEATP